MLVEPLPSLSSLYSRLYHAICTDTTEATYAAKCQHRNHVAHYPCSLPSLTPFVLCSLVTHLLWAMHPLCRNRLCRGRQREGDADKVTPPPLGSVVAFPTPVTWKRPSTRFFSSRQTPTQTMATYSTAAASEDIAAIS